MKIAVCISNVPDTTSKINFTNNDTAFDANGVQFVINPNDEFGLARAIWFQEQQGASITVINVGGSETEPTLRKCLAIGANDAIRINATPIDGFFVAQQIAEIVKKEKYDIIILGRESIDYNGGMVPGLLAGILDYNFINNCIGITVDGNNVKAFREDDEGKETIETSLPVIIGSQKGLVEEKDLKIPNIRGIMSAKTKPLTVVEPIDAKGNTTTVQFEKPAQKQAVKLISSDNLDELIDLLQNEAKVI